MCLFVKDVEAGNKRDYQPTIDYFREKLTAAGITNVKTIMPISQLSQDYKQHEMVRKLCSSYDCFLTDGRIAPHLAKKLGKTFVVQKKSPVSVRLNHPQLKDHFASAVAKVAYAQTSTGDSTGIHVAKHGMSDEQVVDNIHRLLANMQTEFHGGWANLKRAYLRPAINLSKSSILLYANASSGKDVAVPVIEGPRAKALVEKQRKMNALLPEGMVMTSKGELAIVGKTASRKRPAEEESKERPAVEKKKPKQHGKKAKEAKEARLAAEAAGVEEEVVASEKPAKKEKKKSKAEVVVPVAVVAVPEKVKKGKKAAAEPEPTPVPVAVKKDKKSKKVAEEVVVAAPAPVEKESKKKSKKAVAAVEAVPEPEVEKKQKKGKKSAAVEDEKPAAKKAKKGKSAEAEAVDGDLSKEVSDLWEQIKNESAAELGELPEPKNNNKKGGKNQKKKATDAVEVVTEKKTSKVAGGDKKKDNKKAKK